jgi:hypothetical protein
VAAPLSITLLSQSSVAETGNPAHLHRATTKMLGVGQPHQCGSGNDPKRSCVVTGLFSNCNDAEIPLKAWDCCPTTAGGGTSSAFYPIRCIPDFSGR